MRNLPRAIIPIPHQCELLCGERAWGWDKILLIGAILAPGKRTVTAVLRVMGLSNDAQFQNDYCGLNRAVWSLSATNRILRCLLLNAFVPLDAPVVLGHDDHSERRRRDKIKTRGIDRDPVHLSRSFFVKTSGLAAVKMVTKVLNVRFGPLDPRITAQIAAYPYDMLEALNVAQVAFTSLADLEAWLAANPAPPWVDPLGEWDDAAESA